MNNFDLHSAAIRVMTAYGFPVAFPQEITQSSLKPHMENASDLRGLIWSSIDNAESRDLDQVEVTEARSDGTVKLMVGIADVDSFVPKGSTLDIAARERATSVYTGIENFPMLPAFLSEDKTSLLADVDRFAMVTELLVGPDGAVSDRNVRRGLLRNRAKLTYAEIGAWLEGHGKLPASASSVPGLASQLRVQETVSAHLREIRVAAGALDFESVETQPIMENGRVVGLTLQERGRSRYIIENFMVAANAAVSQFLRERNFPSIQRIVRRPARWDRIVEIAHQFGATLPDEPNALALSDFLVHRKLASPEHFADLSLSIVKLLGPGEYVVVEAGGEMGEHFGLAVQGYTHSTAPNRRYVDLVTQRLLKAACAGAPCPYSHDELVEIALHCSERTKIAKKISRIMRKAAAAMLLKDRIGEVYRAVVTGAKPSGVYVRVADPPVEGRVTRGEKHLDVGDRVQVRLISVDPEQGYIDFERA